MCIQVTCIATYLQVQHSTQSGPTTDHHVTLLVVSCNLCQLCYASMPSGGQTKCKTTLRACAACRPVLYSLTKQPTGQSGTRRGECG